MNAQAENLETNNGTASATRLTVPKGSGKEIYYIHADHLNTPRVLTNTSGITVWRWDNSDPFGNNTALEDPDADGQKVVFNLRFPGQYFDKETGLHYNYYRDYNPRTGRYVQSDPIGLRGGVNTFGYVGGNPLLRFDPNGLVQVNMFNPQTDPHFQAFQNAINTYRDVPNVCIVYAHGTRDGKFLVGKDGKRLNAAKLANELKKAGCKEDMRVELYACNAGKGKKPIAKELTQYFSGGVMHPINKFGITK